MEKVEGQDAEEAARRHAELHFGGVGVDAPQPTDQYYRLLVDRCFYVGGMGSKCQAEVITAAEYMVCCTRSDTLQQCLSAVWMAFRWGCCRHSHLSSMLYEAWGEPMHFSSAAQGQLLLRLLPVEEPRVVGIHFLKL